LRASVGIPKGNSALAVARSGLIDRRIGQPMKPNRPSHFDKGCSTDVNTPGTKVVVGFSGGKEQTLGDMKVQVETPFASLFLTALDGKEDLAHCFADMKRT
jgi:hypothetical protein